MMVKTICENCGAREGTPASVDAICIFCTKGRMRADFILRLNEKGEIENCIVLEYNPGTLREMFYRKAEMLKLQPLEGWAKVQKISLNGR
jgi:hypothetical protein